MMQYVVGGVIGAVGIIISALILLRVWLHTLESRIKKIEGLLGGVAQQQAASNYGPRSKPVITHT
jgi:hypothetical protein